MSPPSPSPLVPTPPSDLARLTDPRVPLEARARLAEQLARKTDPETVRTLMHPEVKLLLTEYEDRLKQQRSGMTHDAEGQKFLDARIAEVESTLQSIQR